MARSEMRDWKRASVRDSNSDSANSKLQEEGTVEKYTGRRKISKGKESLPKVSEKRPKNAKKIPQKSEGLFTRRGH